MHQALTVGRHVTRIGDNNRGTIVEVVKREDGQVFAPEYTYKVQWDDVVLPEPDVDPDSVKAVM